MGDKSSIEWTNATWNPVRGCSRVSPGCENCYAERVAARFSGPGKPYHGLAVMGESGPRWTREVRMVPEHLADPLRWKKPRRIFVNSMSDLFHEGLTNEEIAAVFGVMAAAPSHTFQILTKRAKRMREWFEWIARKPTGLLNPARATWPNVICALEAQDELQEASGEKWHWTVPGDQPWPLPNVWLGVSVEDQRRADERIPDLLATPAAVRFVSYEPALGPIDFTSLPANHVHPLDGSLNVSDYVNALTGVGHHPQDRNEELNRFARLDWVIVGGESGPGARPCDIEWIRDIMRNCKSAGVPCFVKQLGRLPSLFGVPARYYDGHEGAEGWSGGRFKDPKGGDWDEWPIGFRVREFPA